MLHARPHLRRAVSRPRAAALAGCIGLSGISYFGSGCTLPRDGATGLELRWQLPEGGLADDPGISLPRLRSCSGALVTDVVAELVDQGEPSRRRTFMYPCEVGEADPAELVTEAARIFIDLRPGVYTLALRWADEPGERDADGARRELGALERTVTIVADSLTALDLDLTRPLLPWTLDLRGSATCTQAALEIYYDDPNADLHDLPEQAAGRYRTGLVSDRGLALGAVVPCALLVDGPQRFPALDRGRYRLRLAVDARVCERGFTVDEAAAPLAVDLAKPGCAG